MRNVFCPRYGECLGKAARANAPGFECRGCRHAGDREVQLDESDLDRCRLLILAACLPEKFIEYTVKKFRAVA